MRKFFINLLGGIDKQTHQKLLFDSLGRPLDEKIDVLKLDFCSDVLKRWNEYRESINTLSKEVLKFNANYYIENKDIFFHLYLQDYYFRRLYLLRYKHDFYQVSIEESERFIADKKYLFKEHILRKAFWELEPKFLELVYDNKFIKDWNKGI